MADKLKEIPAKILEWWNKFTTRQKSIIVGAAAVVIFAFAIIMYVMSKPQYVRLITCETTSQASEIIDTLDSAGIAHKESNDGLKIDVESSQQSAANLALGSAGYVPDALDLNDYLGGSMSTTATDKERLYNSYLEKYITQTIEAQSAVKSAKVHLSFPKDNGTLAAQKEEASAFIQLELDGTFTSANAAALAKCVATWLRNDTTANITIMDTDSNLLFAGGDDYSTAGIANSMQELQNQAESMIANLCVNTTSPEVALELHADRRNFKLYMGDTGLLVSQIMKNRDDTEEDLYKSLIFDRLGINQGMIMENLVAQMLRSRGYELYFHEFEISGGEGRKPNKYEIDFLLVRNKKLCPIEVKSSGYKNHKSFDMFAGKYPAKVQERYMICAKDLSVEENIIRIPLYMTMCL